MSTYAGKASVMRPNVKSYSSLDDTIESDVFKKLVLRRREKAQELRAQLLDHTLPACSTDGNTSSNATAHLGMSPARPADSGPASSNKAHNDTQASAEHIKQLKAQRQLEKAKVKAERKRQKEEKRQQHRAQLEELKKAKLAEKQDLQQKWQEQEKQITEIQQKLEALNDVKHELVIKLKQVCIHSQRNLQTVSQCTQFTHTIYDLSGAAQRGYQEAVINQRTACECCTAANYHHQPQPRWLPATANTNISSELSAWAVFPLAITHLLYKFASQLPDAPTIPHDA